MSSLINEINRPEEIPWPVFYNHLEGERGHLLETGVVEGCASFRADPAFFQSFTLIDIHPDTEKLIRSAAPDYFPLRHADILACDIREFRSSKKFSLILCMNILHLIPYHDQEKVMQNLMHHMSDGGLLYLIANNQSNFMYQDPIFWTDGEDGSKISRKSEGLQHWPPEKIPLAGMQVLDNSQSDSDRHILVLRK